MSAATGASSPGSRQVIMDRVAASCAYQVLHFRRGVRPGSRVHSMDRRQGLAGPVGGRIVVAAAQVSVAPVRGGTDAVRGAFRVGEFGQDRDAVALQPLPQAEACGSLVSLDGGLDDDGHRRRGDPGNEPALRVVSQHADRGVQEALCRGECSEPSESVVPEPPQVGAQRPVLLDGADRHDDVGVEMIGLDKPDAAAALLRTVRPPLQFLDVLRCCGRCPAVAAGPVAGPAEGDEGRGVRFVAGPGDPDAFAQELGEQLVVEDPVQARDPGVPGRQGTVSFAPLRLQPLFPAAIVPAGRCSCRHLEQLTRLLRSAAAGPSRRSGNRDQPAMTAAARLRGFRRLRARSPGRTIGPS